jgi:acyloxyacyl hydrolase
MRMRNRNLCNHRDYQNVGFNGGSMRHLVSNQIKGVSIRPTNKPYLAFITYIGNDVCKPELERMTTTEEYQKQLIEGLEELDKISPSNSKILVTGLVDGRILWREMSHRKHPFGSTYRQVYNFLDCTDANTCKFFLLIKAKHG